MPLYQASTSGNTLLDTTTQTSSVAIVGTSAAAATSVLNSSALVLTSATNIVIRFQFPTGQRGTTWLRLILIADDGITPVTVSGGFWYGSGGADYPGGMQEFDYAIPANGTYTFRVKGYVDGGTGYVTCGAGGAGAFDPARLRVYRQG